MDIIYFPLWWYTDGFLKMVVFIGKFIKNREKSLALFVWMKNLFTPMYGQSDWQGRIISFFIRLFQIIIRGAIMIVWLALAFIMFLIWTFLPVLVIYEIYYQLNG